MDRWKSFLRLVQRRNVKEVPHYHVLLAATSVMISLRIAKNRRRNISRYGVKGKYASWACRTKAGSQAASAGIAVLLPNESIEAFAFLKREFSPLDHASKSSHAP